MSEGIGRVVWHDLLTTDVEAAKAFYCAVFGWAAADVDMGGGAYTLLPAGDEDAPSGRRFTSRA